jgi:NADH-quinone oxidoreductase subunit M
MKENLLSVVIFLPLAGAILLVFIRGERAMKWTALSFALATLVLSLLLPAWFDFKRPGLQFETDLVWIRAFDLGTRYHIGVDGLSLWLIVLTALLTWLAIISSWDSISYRPREFLACMLALESGMIGVFASMDLFLFYVFWEVMLVPMYFLIGVWGGERRVYAAIKFVIYTVVGSLLMLAGIIALYYLNGRASGNYTFDIRTITANAQSLGFLDAAAQRWLFWAFGLAFFIKVPLFPLHTWLPDAHVEAPTAGSVILAGVLLKMGAYGLMRLNLPLFPQASRQYALPIAVLAVAGIIYGALVAMVQPDLKKLVAYSSVSHMGLVVLGIFSMTDQGLQGALYQMLNHGISTGALFMLVGMIYDRRHTRLIAEFGGLASVMPTYSALFMIVVLSSIALPMTSGFVGEFLVLVGTFNSAALPSARLLAALAATGMILSAAYMLWMYQRVIFGQIRNPENAKLGDLNLREKVLLAPIVALIFLMGVYPGLLLARSELAIRFIKERVAATALARSCNLSK